MSAWVTITLDTTAPSLTGNLTEGGAGEGTLTLTSNDAAEVKVWGDIDVTWPGNASFGETEAEAEWIEFAEIIAVRLSGAKQLHVRVRDDVWNESSVLTVGIGSLPPPPPPGPRPSHTLPEAAPDAPDVRTVVTTSRLRITSTGRIIAAPKTAVGLALTSGGRITARRASVGRLVVGSTALLQVRSSGRVEVAITETAAVHRRHEGPQTEAVLLDLDLL